MSRTDEALGEFMRLATQEVATGQKRPSTLRQYRLYLPRLLALRTMSGWSLGEITYVEVTSAHVAAVLHTFARTPCAPRKGRRLASASGLPAAQTVRNARSSLGAFFAEIDMALTIERPNPAHGIDLRRTIGRRPSKEPIVLTSEQVASLIECVRDVYRPIVTLISETGLRSAEARGLRWVDVDGDTIRVGGQADDHGGYSNGGKTRYALREVPLTSKALTAIESQRALTGTGRFVFAARAGGTLAASTVWRAVGRGCVSAGIPQVGVHELRHTFGMQAVERGMPIPVLSKLLGHSDPGFTASKYLRAEIDLEAKRRAMRAAFGD